MISTVRTVRRMKAGPAGDRGRLNYPSGIWNVNTTYKCTSQTAPFVLYEPGNTYYVLNKEGSFKGINPATDYAANGLNATWIPFENFKAAYLEILFARFGMLGSAVFYDDYMFSQHGKDRYGNPTEDYSGFASGTFTPNLLLNLRTGEIECNNAYIRGVIDALSGSMGGFEIANGRIGSVADPNSSDGGELAIYKDFFRVGGADGYVFFGDNVISSFLGGGYNASGRVVQKAEKGAYTTNAGIYMDVSGATRNYCIDSNAAIRVPASVNTKVRGVTFGTPGGYSMDISQYTTFIVYSASAVSVTLPSESDVSTLFGYSSLPTDFGCRFTLIARGRTARISINGVYDNDNNLINLTMEEGDVLEILCTKFNSFQYKVLSRYY